MDRNEIKNNLITYLNKKGITDIKIFDDNVDIFYSKYDIKFTIRLSFYSNRVKYSTIGASPKYKKLANVVTYYRKSTCNRRGGDVTRYVGGEDINKLRTKYTRSNFNNAVYKNVLLIKTWIEPRFEEQKKVKDELRDYTSELKFYFEDKYGKVDLSISGNDNRRDIVATFTNEEGASETHYMYYEDGNYFLNQISTSWNWQKEKKVYKQREKVLK